MMYRPPVCIVSGAHLCRNPRVVKEANVLSDSGYDIVVVRPVLSNTLEQEDQALTADATWGTVYSVDLRARMGGTLARLQRKASTQLTAWGWERSEALGYGVRQAYRKARSLNADLYIGHQEVGAWVAWRLLQDGYRVGADLEDWYARDLLPKNRVGRPVRLLQRIEADLLRQSAHVTTTSSAMAEAMAVGYDAPVPTVVYNAFPWADRDAIDGSHADRDPSDDRPSLHWVSQTIGPGRGLETLCRALQRVDTPVQVHLRGHCRPAYRERLNAIFPYDQGHALMLHKLVPPAELLSRIAEHDVGLALEPNVPDNKLYTVSNKILHYVLGGLAVVATDTAGQKEVARQAPGAVRLCAADHPGDLARAITMLVRDRENLQRAKRSALEAAEATFSWEQQAPRLAASVARALSEATARRSAL